MSDLSRTLVLLPLSLLLVCGCYTRANLKVKPTPPAAKVRVEFLVGEGLANFPIEEVERAINGVDAFGRPYAGNAVQDRATARQQSALLAQMGPNLTKMLRTDLVKRRVGFAITDPQVEADLELRGTFRRDSVYGIGLDWELLEIQSGAVVSGGTETVGYFDASVERFADSILAQLLEIDIDAYASATGTGPLAPEPSLVLVDDPPASATDGSNAWAVVIGIERYREELPIATHAEADARVFAAYAEKTLGVPPAHIKLILGDRAGRADIASVLKEWLPRNATQEGGKVYVFFSGHGAPDVETGDAFLVPWDGDPSYLKTRGYPVSTLYDDLRLLRGQRIVVFLDACFSGAGGRSVLAQGTRPLVPVKDPNAGAGVISFAAASGSQTTGAARQGRHGLFTYHLLAGLGGQADRDNDKNVSLAELVQHVAAQVQEDARLDNREQDPKLSAPVGLDATRFEIVTGLEDSARAD